MKKTITLKLNGTTLNVYPRNQHELHAVSILQTSLDWFEKREKEIDCSITENQIQGQLDFLYFCHIVKKPCILTRDFEKRCTILG